MIMRRTGTRIIAALIVAGAITVSASPGHALGTSEQRAACTPDVFRLCSSEIPNVDHIIACLKKEKPRLSEGCRAAVEASR
jgi:hypothetical protein